MAEACLDYTRFCKRSFKGQVAPSKGPVELSVAAPRMNENLRLCMKGAGKVV